jgi:hypothetical protein
MKMIRHPIIVIIGCGIAEMKAAIAGGDVDVIPPGNRVIWIGRNWPKWAAICSLPAGARPSTSVSFAFAAVRMIRPAFLARLKPEHGLVCLGTGMGQKTIVPSQHTLVFGCGIEIAIPGI